MELRFLPPDPPPAPAPRPQPRRKPSPRYYLCVIPEAGPPVDKVFDKFSDLVDHLGELAAGEPCQVRMYAGWKLDVTRPPHPAVVDMYGDRHPIPVHAAPGEVDADGFLSLYAPAPAPDRTSRNLDV